MLITAIVLATFLAAALYTRRVIDQDGYGSRPQREEQLESHRREADRLSRPTSML